MTKTQPQCGQKIPQVRGIQMERTGAQATQCWCCCVHSVRAAPGRRRCSPPGPKPAPPLSGWTGLMVSTYDESTDRAYANYPGGTSLERWNRALLAAAMDLEASTQSLKSGGISTTKTGDNTPSRISRSTRSVHQKTLMTRGFHND